MAAPKQQVDAYLGNGWYDEWQKMDQQETDAEHLFFQNRVRLRLPLGSPLIDRVWADFNVVTKIQGDYARGMTQIVNGRRPNKEKIGQVHDLYTLALIVVDTENEILDAMFGTGLVAAWVIFPFLLLQVQAKGMLDALQELKKELEKAEHEVSNARNKRAFHLAVAFFEAIFPEISLTARAAIFLGDVIVDKALGPPDPTTQQKYQGIVTPGVKQFSEAVHNIPEYGHTAHAVASKMGKVATVATFYFDYEEISEGTERVEKLKELTEKVKSGYDSLVKVIEDNKIKIEQFLRAFERWTQNIEKTREANDTARKQLKDDMAEYQYSMTRPMAWPDAA
jgi:uncharacterized membrane protein YciS (DUF1049 family)